MTARNNYYLFLIFRRKMKMMKRVWKMMTSKMMNVVKASKNKE